METLLIGFGVGFVKYLLWSFLLLFGIAIFKAGKSRLDANIELEMPASPFDVIMGIKWRIVTFIFLLLTLSYLTVAETAYRPKTQTNQTNYTLDKQLEEIDNAEIIIPKAKHENVPNWQEVKAKSDAENEAAKAKFNELPKADKKSEDDNN